MYDKTDPTMELMVSNYTKMFKVVEVTCSIIVPPKNGIEYGPILSRRWRATVKMPHITLHTVWPWASATSIVNVGTNYVIECICLECRGGSAKQPSTDEQEEVGHDDQKDS